MIGLVVTLEGLQVEYVVQIVWELVRFYFKKLKFGFIKLLSVSHKLRYFSATFNCMCIVFLYSNKETSSQDKVPVHYCKYILIN
ncbi:unnamed protein product [Schistosoma mattheei]|uniref:Uncharacterized protein n=1 Tax=Schistosoma mattheei TaxID=31246 RepID=A0A183PPC1_9TREM|nr:unnamed protein product [Schistosoma mattheei]